MISRTLKILLAILGSMASVQITTAQDDDSERLRLTRMPLSSPTIQQDAPMPPLAPSLPARVKNASPKSNIPAANQGVLNFALANIGNEVGNGECWTLIAEALRVAGARAPHAFNFGEELGKNEPWLPGDIIHFHKCKFEEHGIKNKWWVLGSPNHAAIIQSAKGKETVIIHQNANNSRKVQMEDLNFENLTDGKYTVYRPISITAQSVSSNNYAAAQAQHPHGNIFALLQQPAAPGPLYQERAATLERIRSLKARGVRVFFYLQRYLDIETTARTANNDPSPAQDSTIQNALGTLNQLLSIRESLLNQAQGTPSQ
ncbi:MAG: hypothetical protein K2W82_07630 [Candidatus Obscuribacterales bacterium]|nr:hypothetical protein [Candidatus Obscuribacterales bacterium]